MVTNLGTSRTHETSGHMLSSTSLKMLLSLSAGEWGAAVEEAVSSGLPRGEAHDLCECFKMHSIDVAQLYTSFLAAGTSRSVHGAPKLGWLKFA